LNCKVKKINYISKQIGNFYVDTLHFKTQVTSNPGRKTAGNKIIGKWLGNGSRVSSGITAQLFGQNKQL
jgi:hypothetical protein